MKVLLTGASGLLGSHLLEQGLKWGHQFIVISRNDAQNLPKRGHLHTLLDKVKLVQMDLAKVESYPDNLFKGVDLIINAAALASSRSGDADAMQAVNIQGPVQLYHKAKSEGIFDWVQISSISTMCDGTKKADEIVTESDHGKFRPTLYAKQKYELDQWLESQQEGMKTLFLHPCYMLGRYDSRPSSGAIFMALKMKKFPLLVDAQKNFVAASDVAKGVWQAIASKKTGHYILGGHNHFISDFIQLSLGKLSLPPGSVAFVDQQTFDHSELMNHEQKAFAKEFCLASAVSFEKASKDFGYAPELNLEQMTEEAITAMFKGRKPF